MPKRMFPFVLALLIVLGDRWSKLGIRHAVSAFESIPVVPGWLRIIHTENPGAAFGILANGSPWLRSAVLIGISSLVLVFVVLALWGRTSSFNGSWARAGLGLVLGGAAGNLYDRVVHGTVTDFIEVYHGAWSFPAFNVADSAITVGAVVLLLEMIFTRDREAARNEPARLAHN